MMSVDYGLKTFNGREYRVRRGISLVKAAIFSFFIAAAIQLFANGIIATGHGSWYEAHVIEFLVLAIIGGSLLSYRFSGQKIILGNSAMKIGGKSYQKSEFRNVRYVSISINPVVSTNWKTNASTAIAMNMVKNRCRVVFWYGGSEITAAKKMSEPTASALVGVIEQWLADDTSGAAQAGSADPSVAYRLGALVRKVAKGAQ